MAFLPALPPAPNVSKKSPRKQKKTHREPPEDHRKGYRVSLLHLDETNANNDPFTTARHAKQANYAISNQDRLECTVTENSILSYANFSQQPKPHRLQSLEKQKQTPTEPTNRLKCQDSVASGKCMLQWMEPLGLWIPVNQGERFYQKFSTRKNLCYKDPDYLMDPCPHIPRCNHSRSWSAVKLERQRFRELSRLRDEQSFSRTIERYREMEDAWLHQLDIVREVSQNTSSQERLEKFRRERTTCECAAPLSESQRLERLHKRSQEWEDAWRRTNEGRVKNSTKKRKECFFPRIIITDHDAESTGEGEVASNEDGVFDEIRCPCGEHVMAREEHVTARDEHVTICGIRALACGEHVPAHGEHVTTCGVHVTVNTSESRCVNCEHFDEKYDILCAPVNCFAQVSQETVKNGEKRFAMQQADYVETRPSHLERKESFAVIRRTPRVSESERELDSRRIIPKDLLPISAEDEQRFEPTAGVESLSNFETKEPSSLSCLSLSETEHEASFSIINNFTDTSSSLSLGTMDLGTMDLGISIRQADNTVQVMSQLLPVPLGMTSGEIPDQRITASSTFDLYRFANQARLYNEKKDQNGGAWIPKLHDANPYLEIDIGQMMTIEQVATQGNPGTAVKHERHKRWVTKFSLQFSEDGKKWRDYEESGCVKEFSGNSDLDTVVLNSLGRSVEARFVRFMPKEWHNWIAMRVEIFGQKPLPEGYEDDGMKTSPFELRESSSDLSEACIKDTEIDKEDELQQLFTGNEIDSENDEFCLIEERVVTPAILESPVSSLVSPRALHIEQEDWQEAKFCVNPLPPPCINARTTNTNIHQKPCDQPQRKPSTEKECLENEKECLENEKECLENEKECLENEKECLVDKKELLSATESDQQLESHPITEPHVADDKKEITKPKEAPHILQSSQNLTEEPSLAAENSKRRDLNRAQTDGSIQRQLRREKMAEERRKKLSTLNSPKSWRRAREGSAPSEVIGNTDELGGLLEKYCIIGKSEAIVYKKVFEKFDQDEDGFLWPEEVLEALENVNTDLLKDSHLRYVFRILEQCDCQVESGTGLRLFTVIAALSQRVAALNNKMKILISKCDFKIIDSTLLRAKMLFECYVNEHTKKISRGDLWIGLAAGGLWTGNETVKDCFEGRQNFDFLDFLTYLPLFQVIHGYVIDNPLTVF